MLLPLLRIPRCFGMPEPPHHLSAAVNREGHGQLGDLRFILVDNAGLECNATKGSIQVQATSPEAAPHPVSCHAARHMHAQCRPGGLGGIHWGTRC